jgi:hypothetical protein
MKQIIKSALVGTLLLVGMVQSQAAPTTATNYVLNVNFTLTAYTNGTKAVSIKTKDVINALQGSVTNFIPTATNEEEQVDYATNVVRYNFASNAKLKYCAGRFFVRQVVSRTNVDTDVTSYFDKTDLASVESVKGTTTTKRSYSSLSLSHTITEGTILLTGTGKETDGKVSTAVTNTMKSLAVKVGGMATFQGAFTNAVVTGLVSFSGGKLE